MRKLLRCPTSLEFFLFHVFFSVKVRSRIFRRKINFVIMIPLDKDVVKGCQTESQFSAEFVAFLLSESFLFEITLKNGYSVVTITTGSAEIRAANALFAKTGQTVAWGIQ